ncbi:MAG: BACON domain-containing carbohydrate-binding protein [Acidobacteriota bacterium]|nr:BACON domain-containing carbohydrate-binding protein [Acidobacteriota bacterium]
MANNHTSPTKPTLLSYINVLTGIVCLLFVVLVIGLMVRSSGNVATPEEILVVGILFSIAFLFQWGGVRRLHNLVKDGQNKTVDALGGPAAWEFYTLCLWCMLICLAVLTGVFFLYAFGWWDTGAKYVTFAGIILLLIPAIGITYIIMESPDSEGASDPNPRMPQMVRRMLEVLKGTKSSMKSSVSTTPYWALLFFVGLFLYINYLLSFAFAFHDRSTLSWSPIPALHMQPLPDPAATPDPSNTTGNLPIVDLKGPYEFSFESNKARLLYDHTYSRNKQKLDELVADIRTETRKGRRVVLMLKGQADSEKAKAPEYSSNYELSEARVLRVKNEILEQVSSSEWYNIEWHYVPLSNDVTNSDKRALVNLITFQEQSQLLPQKSYSPTPFSLLTYVVYTITGAGFGDVFPMTPYSKFLISLANILQMFFLVALFSAVFTLQKKGQAKSPPTNSNDGEDGVAILAQGKETIVIGLIEDKETKVISLIADKQTKITEFISDLLAKTNEPYCTNATAVFPASGGFGNVDVAAQSNVNWKVKYSPPWVKISDRDKEEKKGNGTVEYEVEENKGINLKKDRIIIEVTESGRTPRTQALPINQSGCSPTVSIFPTRKLFYAIGGYGEIKVSAPEECSWEAESHADWIKLKRSSTDEDVVERTGDGTVEYEVDKNNGSSKRSGLITIAGHRVDIVQEKAACNYTLSPLTKTFPKDGGSGEVEVFAEDDCEWEVTNNCSWIQIVSGKRGIGKGTVKYNVRKNATGEKRDYTMQIAEREHMVVQLY